MSRSIFLVGPMGSGKSRVGALLARRLERPFADTDELVERTAGMSIQEVFDSRGEEGFRELETRALSEAASIAGAVVACGGGIVLRPGNVATMRASGDVVYLEVDAKTAAGRLGSGRGRPLLSEGEVGAEMSRLIDERRALYLKSANYRVDGSASIDVVVEDIVSLVSP